MNTCFDVAVARLLVLFSLLCCGCNSSPTHASLTGSTSSQQKHEGPNVIESVAFSDRLHGWAVSDNGLWSTKDGGTSWMLLRPTRLETLPGGIEVQEQIGPLQLLEPDCGWIVEGGKLLSSRDGGESWKAAALPNDVEIRDFRFADPRHGWAVGARIGSAESESGGDVNVVLVTEDAGATWNDVRFRSAALRHPYSIWPINKDVVWLGGKVPMYSRDHGVTWHRGAFRGEEFGFPCPIRFLDDDTGTIVPTQGPRYLVTHDGGATWGARDAPPDYASISNVIYTEQRCVWIVDGIASFSADDGLSWTRYSDEQFFAAHFVPSANVVVLAGSRVVVVDLNDLGASAY